MGTVDYAVMNGRIVSETRGGNRRYYHADALGSTVALYNDSQTKTDSFKYWPYGEDRSVSNPTGTTYKFVGTLGCRKQADGAIYMRARVEEPQHGRWVTVDPLWPQAAAYQYAALSPATLTDPTGFDPPVREAKCRVYKCRANRALHHERICVEGPQGGCYGEVFPGWPGDFQNGIGGLLPCKERYADSTCDLISTSCEFAGNICSCVKSVKSGGFNYWFNGFCYGYVRGVQCCACFKTRRENRPESMKSCFRDCIDVPGVIA